MEDCSLYLSDHRAGTRHGLFQLVERIREGIRSTWSVSFACAKSFCTSIISLSTSLRFNRELIFQLLIF